MKNALLVGLGLAAVGAACATIRNSRKLDFKDKVVLITGGSRGLGLVLAREFAAQGATLAIIARDEIELARAKEELENSGARCFAFACDVRDQFQIHSTIQNVLRRVGRIDVLVNNAGIIEVGPMEEMSAEDYRNAMETHFFGPLNTTLEVVPSMRAIGGGRIVNISSIGGRIAVPHLLPYTASKFALTGLSEGLRGELMKDNIFVTTVCPGMMRTGSHIQAKFKGKNTLEYAWFSIGNALPGLSTSAECAARQIVDACKHGDAELFITQPAQVAIRVAGLVPELMSDVMGVVNRFLPAPGGIGRESRFGKDSGSKISPSVLTTLSDKATGRNNETTSFAH